MLKLKKWQLWSLVLLFLIIATLIIIWSINDPNNQTVTTILLVITFLGLTFSLQSAIMATFKFKPKKKHYKSLIHTASLDEIISNLENESFKKRDIRFGYVYMKIIGKTAYKVTFINNIEEYLKKDVEEKKTSSFPGIDSCTKMIGFEIFLESNDEIENQIVDYSFLGQKIFYEAFILKNNELIEPNYIDEGQEFSNKVWYLKNLLNIKKSADYKVNP